MDYATAQIYAASGFKLVRYTPDWLVNGGLVQFVQSTTGGTYTPVIYINGVSSSYTPTGAESAATDWSVIS